MKSIFKKFAAVVCLMAAVSLSSFAQDIFFPMDLGSEIKSAYYDSKGNLENTFTWKVTRAEGDITRGELDLVFNCFKRDGKPVLDGENEFRMTVSRVDGQTSSELESLAKLTKVQALLPQGDPSGIPSELSVGQEIPASSIRIKVGALKVTVTVSERKVLDHKQITTKAGTFDCWFIKEKSVTKTPVSTETVYLETWYAANIGSVRQTIYDSKGRIAGSQELLKFIPGKK